MRPGLSLQGTQTENKTKDFINDIEEIKFFLGSISSCTKENFG